MGALNYIIFLYGYFGHSASSWLKRERNLVPQNISRILAILRPTYVI